MMTDLNINIIEDGHIATPLGFHADGQHVGLKHKSKDLGWIISDVPASVAGVFTTNQIQAAPVQLTKYTIQSGQLQAIIVNSGNANAVTGPIGLQHAKEMQQVTADVLNLPTDLVAVASTGIIGQVLPIEKVTHGIHQLKATGNAPAFAQAIMTTDTLEKHVTISAEISGTTITMSGVAKGSGMLHPNMATMLAFVTTDANINSDLLQKSLSDDVETSFNQITIDGDTSTNDTVLVMANGQANNPEILADTVAYAQFTQMLHYVTEYLAIHMAKDGEGATKLISVHTNGAKEMNDARMIAKKVVGSSLVKAAIFGKDPNWGRIIAAIGATSVIINPQNIDIKINNIAVLLASQPVSYDEQMLAQELEQDEITIDIDLHSGNAIGKAWGCDLTYEYVKINALYTT